MQAIHRRSVIRGIFCAGVAATAGMALTPDAIGAMSFATDGVPSKTDSLNAVPEKTDSLTDMPSKTDGLVREAQVVVVHPGHRRHRGRRWRCWWHRGRRVCGWR